MNLQKTGEKITRLGIKLTFGISIPMILFVVGLVSFPIGVIFWIMGFVLFFGVFFGKNLK